MKCFHPAFSPLSHPFIPKTFFAKPAVSLTDGLFTKTAENVTLLRSSGGYLTSCFFFFFFFLCFFKDFFET